MPEMRSVHYRGRTLGEVRVYGPEDWRGRSRPMEDRDLRVINATAIADCVHAILEREPLKVCESEPDQPWITVVIREVCTASCGGQQDKKMEEDCILLYVQRYGMDQILSIWGADVNKLAEQLKTMSGLDDSPN